MLSSGTTHMMPRIRTFIAPINLRLQLIDILYKETRRSKLQQKAV